MSARASTGTQYLVTALLTIFVASVVLASEAHCSDVNVVKPAAIYLSLSAADLGSTEWAIRNGGHEANPAMQSNRIAKQALMASAFTAADVALQAKGKKQEARALRVVYAAIRVTAVVLNVHAGRKGAK